MTLVGCLLAGAFCLVPVALTGAQATTGVISGVVVTDGAQPRPVRRAIVTLGGNEAARGRSILTDETGHFAFSDLPAGRFTLSASKASYITHAYGARRPGRPGNTLVLAAGQRLSDLTLTLPRGAVITGAIRDERGELVANVQVNAVPADQMRTTIAPVPMSASAEFLTDDRGVYRIFGLPPGDYVVSAAVRVGPGGMGVMSAAQVDAALRELQLARGRPAGVGATAAGAAPPSTIPPRNDPIYLYAPVFYPGTSVVSDASRITLATGEERAGVDFVLSPTRTATVEGIVTSPDGVVSNVELTIEPEGMSGTIDRLTGPQRPGPDGRFKFPNVAPGSYRISARTSARPLPGAGRAAGAAPAMPSAPSGPPLWAGTSVAVNGQNIEGVSLTLQPGMKFAGRIVFDATTLTPPADLTALRIDLLAPGGAAPTLINGVPRARPVVTTAVRADGSFEAGNVFPGVYRPAVVLASAPGWWLRSVLVDGQDVLDSSLEFRPGGDVTGALFTLTDRHSELAGTLQTPAGSPAPDYFVIAFPANRAWWQSEARRIQATRPASDGRFVLRDLPAGDYLLAALIDVEPADLNDPRFLEQDVPGTVKVTVADGERRTQNLQLAP
jgi:hypothetical protein